MGSDIKSPKTFLELRTEYSDKPLREEDVASDPIKQFESWFSEACAAELYEPNAMILSTVSSRGVPSSRAVLFKGLTDYGFSFYTRYTSRKGQDIASNATVSLLFYWSELHRQVRIVGTARKVSVQQSDEYFSTRPRQAQLGAHASLQSTELEGRKKFEELLAKVEERYQGREIPRPEEWGGYEVAPTSFEFWQGRRSRLHDRLTFEREGEEWRLKRLYP